jgi:hypothetical protein
MSNALRTITHILICFAFLPVPTAIATNADEYRDPPGVARVAAVEGPASYRLAADERWVPVAINAPLVSGDGFHVGDGGRAEIQLAAGTHLRLGGLSEVELVELAPDATQVRVTAGSAILRVRADPRGRHVELDTPDVALLIEQAGDYRVDVDSNGRTRLRVGRGRAVAWSDAGRFDVGPETLASFTAGGRTDLVSIQPDELDAWDERRTRRIDAARSYRYVSEEIYGAEDLDEYGVWEERAGYGALWRPAVVEPGWAPYRNGRWIWVDPWGWTWLDAAAWGWAPFHYGRWVRLDGRWYWGPGPRVARPVYAPALVGFYGAGISFGSSVSISFGLSSSWVGWVPLGWGEPCNPWWGGFAGARVGAPWWGGWGGPRVVNHVYIDNRRKHPTHVRHVNRGQPGGFSVVSRDGFGRGDRVQAPRRGMGKEFRQVGGRVGVTPTRNARRAVDRQKVGISGVRPPGREDQRRVGPTVASHARGLRSAARPREGSGSAHRSIRSASFRDRAPVRTATASPGVAGSGNGGRVGSSGPGRSAMSSRNGRRTSMSSSESSRNGRRTSMSSSESSRNGRRTSMLSSESSRNGRRTSMLSSESSRNGRRTSMSSSESRSVRTSPRGPARSVPSAARTIGKRAEPFVASRPGFAAGKAPARVEGPGRFTGSSRSGRTTWSEGRTSDTRAARSPSTRTWDTRVATSPSRRTWDTRVATSPSRRTSDARVATSPSRRTSDARVATSPSRRTSGARVATSPSRRTSDARAATSPSRRTSDARVGTRPSGRSSASGAPSTTQKKSASALRGSARTGKSLGSRSAGSGKTFGSGSTGSGSRRSAIASSSSRSAGGRSSMRSWNSPGRSTSGSRGGRFGMR